MGPKIKRVTLIAITGSNLPFKILVGQIFPVGRRPIVIESFRDIYKLRHCQIGYKGLQTPSTKDSKTNKR